jgi:two-component system sensor histidine kinase SenX3
VDPSLAALLGGVVGMVLTGSALLAWRVSERSQRTVPQQAEPLLPPGVTALLSALPSSAVIVGSGDDVLQASAPAYSLGVVQGSRLAVPELRDLVNQVRRDGQIKDTELVVRRRPPADPLYLSARVAPLSSRLVLLLVDDRTGARRVEAIRRDFVANVSHELKTPVGAIALLAEAVSDAVDDPEAVQRFATRMQTESIRLGRLVQQIIELSRLQGDDPLEHARPVDVEEIVERAVDRSRVDAESREVAVVTKVQHGLRVSGDLAQLVVALGNLIENAVAYSEPKSTVLVEGRRSDGQVELSVIDRGIGIPAGEVDRIFERFYRVDPARSRATGGTGLGLSIVKHVAASHGGEVALWSVEGQGSSFTVRLPAHASQADDRAPQADHAKAAVGT